MVQLDAVSILKEGMNRATRKNGVMLAFAFFLVNMISTLALTQTMETTGQLFNPLLLPAETLAGLAALSLIAQLASLFLMIVSVRVFVTDETQIVPDVMTKRNMWHAFLQTLIGQMVLGIVILIGFLLFIIPGIYLLIGFVFWKVRVAVEDEDFLTAAKQSWGMVAGHRGQLLILGLGILAVVIGIFLVQSVVSVFLPDLLTLVLTQIASAFAAVFYTATLARTYTRFTE